MYGPEWEFDLLKEAQEDRRALELTMGVYDVFDLPGSKISKYHTRTALVRWAVGALLVGFLLGMAVGVSAEDATTRHYPTRTVSVYVDPPPIGGLLAPDFDCPLGWTYELFICMPDPDARPSYVPVFFDKGACPRG